MTATLTQTILTVDGLRSPLLQAGPAEATEAVVFVHGNPGSSRVWARLVEAPARWPAPSPGTT
jgi:pimeloyl-ACP methyl ester carboxylesterase